MFKRIAAGLIVTTALTGAALAQTSTAPSTTAPATTTAAPMTTSAASGGFVTEQTAAEFRASKFVGLNVYGSENQKVGDIKEILIDGNGQAKAIIIGVGGFLGIGEKNVAVAWNQVEWKMDKAATTASTAPAPAATGTMSGGPATTSSTMPATTTTSTSTRTPAEQAAYNGYPDHAMIKMSKTDLQNAPDFKFYADTRSSNAKQ